MKKLAIVLGVVILLLILLIIFVPPKKSNNSPTLVNGKVSVAASFFPFAEFARNIGGDLVSIYTVTPAGAEPHDYEPSPQDIIKIRASKVFIYDGNGVDVWAEKLAPELRAKGIVVLKMSDSITTSDPHFWLDPSIAQTLVKKISEALVRVDPSHQDAYQANTNVYISQLSDLDQEFKQGLRNCRLHEIVTSHDAFSYVAQRYGFTSLYISGLSPDAEPSAKRLAELVQVGKEKKIQYIFFETLVSPKLSETIATEIGAETLVLNPLEGLTEDQVKSGKNYLSVMRENLRNLRKALDCQ